MIPTSSPPSDDNLSLKAQLQNIQRIDPHWLYYSYTIAQTLKRYGFDVVKSTTGFNFYKIQTAVVILGPMIGVGTIVLRKSARSGNAMMSMTTLPLKLNRSLSNIATRLPIMKLEQLPENIDLSAKILSAVYLMVSSPVISELMATDIVAHIAAANPLVELTTQMMLNLISIKISAQLSTQLAPQFQRIVNEIPAMPFAIQPISTLNKVVQNPHQFTYNAYIIYIVIQQGQQLTGVSFISLIQHAIFMSGLFFTPPIRSLTPQLPAHWMPHLRQLPTSTVTTVSNLYHHTALPISDYQQLESLSTTSRFLHAGTFALMAYSSTTITTSLAYGGIYLCLSSASLHPELLAAPTYNFAAIATQQAVSDMGPIAANLAQLVLMLSSVKVMGEITKVLPTVARYTANVVETAYDYAQAIQLHWRAYRDPTYHFERGVYYEQHNDVPAAVSAYQRVPKPSLTDITNSTVLRNAGVTDITTLDSRFYTFLNEQQLKQLPYSVQVYIKALRGLTMVYVTHSQKLQQAGKFLDAIAAYKQCRQPTSDELTQCNCDTITALFQYYKKSLNDFNEKVPLAAKIYVASQLHISICYLQLATQLTVQHMTKQDSEQVAMLFDNKTLLHLLKHASKEADELNNMLAKDSWEQLRQSAILYKKKKDYPTAFVFYCGTVVGMKANFGSLSDQDQATYYRVVFNCGVMLEGVIAMKKSNAIKQDLLQQAQQCYQQVADHAGAISSTDDSTTRLRTLAGQRLEKISKTKQQTVEHNASNNWLRF